MSWKEYLEVTKERSVQPLLKEALMYVSTPGYALDLGAGALVDSRYLVEQGFEVDAVDNNPASIKYTPDTSAIHLYITTFSEFTYEPQKYTLISAQYALPFQPQKEFEHTFRKILSSLKANGIIAFQLFGVEDTWAGNPEMSFFTPETALALLDSLTVHKFIETKTQGRTTLGKEKFWHVFSVIAEKPI